MSEQCVENNVTLLIVGGEGRTFAAIYYVCSPAELLYNRQA